MNSSRGLKQCNEKSKPFSKGWGGKQGMGTAFSQSGRATYATSSKHRVQ